MPNSLSESVFKKLSDINISTMVKQKGQFWYMPWANAVREVTKNYPDFTWEFTTYDGLPYLKTELGYFVECLVTIQGISRKQLMPVLDFKNQTNMAPKANDINKTNMRALTKAISLFGLGLDLWAGEDLVGWDDIKDSAPEIENPIDELIALLADKDPVQYLPWLKVKSIGELTNEQATAAVLTLRKAL